MLKTVPASVQFRRQVRQKFEQALYTHPSAHKYPMYHLYDIAERLERACNNAAVMMCEEEHIECTWQSKGFLNRYSSIVDKYCRNLDCKSSLRCPEFGERLMNGEIDPDQICSLSSHDINPEATHEEHELLDLRAAQMIAQKYTRRYQCPKCSARKATVDEVQRSAIDEPSHNRITCLECQHVWMKTGI